MLGKDDKLLKQLQAVYEEYNQFDVDEQIEIRLKEIVKKVYNQFKRYKSKRIHISYTPFKIEADKVVKQPIEAEKPEGIWYGFGDSWIDVILDIPEWMGSYAYILEVDESKIKNISKFGMDIFSDEYSIEDRSRKYNWDKISRKYMGVETQHSVVISKLLYTWATISGCIWNPKCIIGMNEIKLELTVEEKEFITKYASGRT